MVTCKVHIIESPSPDDLYDDRHEGRTLHAALTHAGVKASVRTVTNLKQLAKGVAEVVEQAGELNGLPVLHFSMHGNAKGLCLTDGTEIDWPRQGNVLCGINERVGGLLIVSMSTCFGYEATSMAHREKGSPFLALVGPKKEIAWGDTVAAFAGFYQRFLTRGGTIDEGVEAMNSVLGLDLFACSLGENARAAWQREKLVGAYLASVAAHKTASAPPLGELVWELLTGKQQRAIVPR